MAHMRQSRPDSGLGFQETAPETFQVVLSSICSGTAQPEHAGSGKHAPSERGGNADDSAPTPLTLILNPNTHNSVWHCKSFRSDPDRKIDVRLSGKGGSNSHGARPVHLIMTTQVLESTHLPSVLGTLTDDDSKT